MGAGLVRMAQSPTSMLAGPPNRALQALSRAVPSTGEMLPAVGLGTWQSFDIASTDPARSRLGAVLNRFVALGGRVVDSSPMYGDSEEAVGDLVTQHRLRNKLFLATKVWTTGKAAGVTQMTESMRKLRADPIELMQVHNLVDVDTHLGTLREWKRARHIRYLGVTHYTAGSLAELIRLVRAHQLDFVQINYSVGEREAERELLPLARDRGVAVIANRPFAGGDLFSRVRVKPLPTWAADIECASWAQVLLKFVLAHPAITCAIPGTGVVAHLEDNMGAARGPLPDATLQRRILDATLSS